MLLSSSNASTWTGPSDRDLTFRLLEASFSGAQSQQELGSVSVAGATDLLLLSLSETPNADTRVEYDMALPGGEILTVADGQPLRLAAPATGQIRVKARLAGTPTASPVLWPGTQLISGAVGAAADYATRSIPARGATKAVLVYDAVIPPDWGDCHRSSADPANGSVTADGTTNQGDGLVEYRFKAALSNVSEVKVKLTLTGTSTARPRVSNIRLMAVI